MGSSSNRFSEQDLRCDFPARESFRRALLDRLLSMDERELERERESTREPQIIELSDRDLDLIAAAQGDLDGLDNYLKGLGLS